MKNIHKRFIIGILLVLLIIPIIFVDVVKAGFGIAYELDENGTYSIPYISFESEQWNSWRDSGGYIIYSFAPRYDFELVEFRVPGETERIYPWFEGVHTIKTYYADGTEIGSFKQWIIDRNVCEYDEDYLNEYRGDNQFEGNPFNAPLLCVVEEEQVNEEPIQNQNNQEVNNNEQQDVNEANEQTVEQLDNIIEELENLNEQDPPPPPEEIITILLDIAISMRTLGSGRIL